MQISAYLKLLVKRLRIVILIPILASAVTAIISMYVLEPVYESSMTFYVSYNDDDLQVRQQLIKDCQELVKSKLITKAVIERLNSEDLTEDELSKKITVSLKNDSGLIEIKVSDSDGTRAKAIIDEIGTLFQERLTDLFYLNTLYVIDEAEIPSDPSSPNVPGNIVIIFFIALFLSICAVFAAEYFDDTIKNAEDAERILGIKVIAIIPSLDLK